jgi:drug/metabolite transporter (DMT)-like permease
MLLIIGSLFSWLFALRTIPLSVAFTLAGATHVLVPLGSWIWLGEEIPAKRWCGILLVTLGVLVSARPATVVEEKL